MSAGETRQLAASVLPEDAFNRRINWSSSDTSVVMVGGTGSVTAFKAGTAIIAAQSIDGAKLGVIDHYCYWRCRNPLKLDGVTYTKGIGNHAESEVVYALNGNYNRLKSDIGIDDEVGTLGNVVFQVYTDNNKIFESNVMKGTTSTIKVDIDISGATKFFTCSILPAH